MRANGWLRLASVLLLVALGSLAVPAKAQSLQVTSANPDTAPQGSTNLIVKIGGSGFKKGAKSAFYVSGTTNPGGITVNSTAFVSNSEVDANITIASDATLSNFDIYVTSGGRTGKGWNLFSVTSNTNSSSGCVTQGPAAGWTQVDVLNPADSSGAPLYSAGAVGTAVRVQLVSAPDSTGTVVPQFYAGLAGSGSGGEVIAFVLNLNGTIRHSWSVGSNEFTRDIEVGDVNGDGVPDFVMGNPGNNQAHVFIGHLITDSSGNWDYNIDPTADVYLLSAPAGAPGQFGYRVAVGDLTGDGQDEVAVASTAGSTTKHAPPGAVYIYSFNSSKSTWTMVKQISDPGGAAADEFGIGVAIGELTTSDGSASGTRMRDLAVEASKAGIVYVFQNPLGSDSSSTLTFPITAGTLLDHVGIGDVNGDGFPDLVALGGDNGTEVGEVFSGPLYQDESPTLLFPDASLEEGWGTGFSMGDIDGDGQADILVGAPNANYSSACNSSASAGVAYVFRTNSGSFPNYSDLFEVPVVESTYMGFGWSMAAAPFNSTANQPIVLIGENGAMVGTQDGAGQVYIYRKTQ